MPILRRPDESLCESLVEVQDEWRRHFAELEGGVPIDLHDLAQQCVLRQQHTPALEQVDWREIPDFEGVVRAFRQVKPLKAAGPDGLPPAICRRFACDLTTMIWPVILKTIFYRAEPIGYKGGTLFHIPKGNTNKPFCTSDRGILAQPVLGKILHKAMRGLATRGFEKRATDLQLGGRKGMSFAMGCYCTRLFLEFAKAHSLSAGILFCDLASAYYAVVRELLLGKDLTDAPLSEVTRSLGLSDEDLQLLRAYVDHEVIVNADGDESLLQAIGREVHTHTWFWINQDSRLVMTRRGTRPGSSWADVLFGILFAKVLRRRGNFGELGICPNIPWSGKRELVAFDARRKDGETVQVQDVIYADDLATCVLTPSASQLPGAVRHVAGVQYLDTLIAHGLRANVGAKKSAALLVPTGVGAKQVRRQIFTADKGKLTVLKENAGAVQLDAVASYRHLGTILTHNGSLAQEIRVRLAVARAAFKEGRQTVFCTPCIALDRRVLLFKVYMS